MSQDAPRQTPWPRPRAKPRGGSVPRLGSPWMRRVLRRGRSAAQAAGLAESSWGGPMGQNRASAALSQAGGLRQSSRGLSEPTPQDRHAGNLLQPRGRRAGAALWHPSRMQITGRPATGGLGSPSTSGCSLSTLRVADIASRVFRVFRGPCRLRPKSQSEERENRKRRTICTRHARPSLGRGISFRVFRVFRGPCRSRPKS